LEVIVDDTQLSLAIGKKGQNVRLAAKLLGWKIDIKSEEEKRQEVEQQMQALSGGGPSTPIEQVSELGDGIIQKLVAAGITTVEALADMTPEQLEEIPGIGEKTLERSAWPCATTSATLKRAKKATCLEARKRPEEAVKPKSKNARSGCGRRRSGSGKRRRSSQGSRKRGSATQEADYSTEIRGRDRGYSSCRRGEVETLGRRTGGSAEQDASKR
jgi:hypothetical protein